MKNSYPCPQECSCARHGDGRKCKPGCVCGKHKKSEDNAKWTATPQRSTLHQRLRHHKGPASKFSCVDCGEQAKDWSRTHGANGLAYEDYSPRCRSCHRLYDKAEVSAKLSAAIRGRKLTPEWKARISTSLIGNTRAKKKDTVFEHQDPYADHVAGAKNSKVNDG